MTFTLYEKEEFYNAYNMSQNYYHYNIGLNSGI